MKSFAFLGLAAALCLTVPADAQEVSGAARVTGAGSTFAYPAFSKWSKAYHRWMAGGGEFAIAGGGLDDPPTGAALDYEPIGSLAGTMRVKEAAVDFGASDVPLPPEELKKLGLGQFPVLIGGVVTVVNLDGVGPNTLKVSGALLADIYLGKVQSWSDPAIKTLNPDLKLPDTKINVVRRADGSGTTYNFTNYLSKVSTEWKDKVGSDLIVKWPTGTGAKGNDGIAQAVRQTKNSIGYVEYSYALQAKLSTAQVQNRASKFVTPNAASFQAAAAGADWAKAGDFNLLLTDTAGDGAYPIVATVFILMHKDLPPRRIHPALGFIQWSLEKGQKDASDLGYVPLPEALVGQVKSYWASTFKHGM